MSEKQMTAQKKIANQLNQQTQSLLMKTNVISRLTTVDASLIANRLETIETIADFQTVLNNVDPEFSIFKERVCRKTGQYIGTNEPHMITRAIDCLGRDKAKTILEAQYSEYCAPHWVDTSPENLAELAKRDPYGYFVFASAKCMKLDGQYKSVAEVERVMQHANNIEALSLKALVGAVKQKHDLREQFSYADSDTDKASRKDTDKDAKAENLTPFTSKFMNVRIREQMYANLTASDIPLAQIIEANELMRRLLALNHPRTLPTSDKFWGTPMYATTGELQMAMWITVIQETHAKSIRAYMAKRLRDNVDLAKRTPTVNQLKAHIANYTQAHGGLSSFAYQAGISKARAEEAAIAQITELDLFGKAQGIAAEIKARGRTDTANNSRMQERNTQFSGRKSQTKNVPFKIKFKKVGE